MPVANPDWDFLVTQIANGLTSLPWLDVSRTDAEGAAANVLRDLNYQRITMSRHGKPISLEPFL